MNRWTLGLAALVVAASTTVAMPAKAGTSVDVQIQVGDRYRGGEVVFRSEPDVVVVPSTRVYFVRDYNHDVYRYGSYWYFVDRDHWYRAHSWRGPFYHVRYSSVPRPICTVPVQYRRHWRQPGPPSHAVAKGYYKEKGAPNHYNHDHDSNARANSRDRDDDREAYNGNGNNNGHSHGKHGH
ncbi:MAG TPA: hypothetical protein VL857_03585 [Candidatus Eisenbacteria bacterium]|nr:hypothetical protein [Candidatus Eisenbacteria bacterium]